MKISTKMTDGVLTVFFNGELDHSVAETVRNQLDLYLEKVQPERVVLDMKGLTFMDSTGVGLIIGRYKKLFAKRVPLGIVNPNPQIDKIIRINGNYNIIPLVKC